MLKIMDIESTMEHKSEALLGVKTVSWLWIACRAVHTSHKTFISFGHGFHHRSVFNFACSELERTRTAFFF